MVGLAVAAGLFTPDETGFLFDVFGGFFRGEAPRHQLEVIRPQEKEKELKNLILQAAIYHGPAEESPLDLWEVVMIAVDPALQRSGLGSQMLRHAEDHAKAQGYSRIKIDTSSGRSFEKSRSFYAKHGYSIKSTIPDAYGPGEAKVVFEKST